MNKIEQLIKGLKLIPLEQEGGYFASAYRSNDLLKTDSFNCINGDHPLYSSIYFLITKKDYSHMHVLKNDEMWFYHSGSSVKMLFIYPDNHSEIILLGPNISNGEKPQVLCPKGVYQGCIMQEGEDEYSLVSCVNVPGYLDCDFKLGNYEQLVNMLSDAKHVELLKKLTDFTIS